MDSVRAARTRPATSLVSRSCNRETRKKLTDCNERLLCLCDTHDAAERNQHAEPQRHQPKTTTSR
jgi:hypothetical protein